ncbi:OmpA family protein [Pedobacter immunditicola]|uniref:OmpA family protein n=1 Tax=Pedobacter immunditicola TaxID=3133440 RepID=UPI0030B792EE
MVERKPGSKNNWLLWLIGIVVVMVIAFFLFRDNTDTAYQGAASDSATIESEINNNWTGIDPNIPVANYEELKDTSVHVKANNDYAVYSLKEAILFEPGKDSIGEIGAEKLGQISTSAEKRFAGGQIIIYGYTDSTGTQASNKELALKRANAVKSWLIRNGNIIPNRISVKTEGESNPVSSNSTVKGRAENRRVDIVVRKKEG